jgi:hypothetical protein
MTRGNKILSRLILIALSPVLKEEPELYRVARHWRSHVSVLRAILELRKQSGVKPSAKFHKFDPLKRILGLLPFKNQLRTKTGASNQLDSVEAQSQLLGDGICELGSASGQFTGFQTTCRF